MLKTSLLLCICILVKISLQADNVSWKCPTPPELNGCECIEAIKQLQCSGAKAKPLSLAKPYNFSTVIIRKDDDLAKFFDYEKAKENLQTETLIFQELSPGDNELEAAELETLLSIVTKELTIEGPEGTKKLKVNAHNLRHNTLESLTLKTVETANFAFPKMGGLKSLELINVNFQSESLQIDTSLTKVSIEKSTLKVVKVKPDICAKGERVHIYLRENSALESFNLEDISVGTGKCSYYIDLSGSSKLDILAKNQNLINKATKGQLYLVMREVPQTCTLCLQKIANDENKQKGYWHGIKCKNSDKASIAGKYLTELDGAAITDLAGTDCKVEK